MNLSLQDKPCSNQMADSWLPTAVISHFYSAVYVSAGGCLYGDAAYASRGNVKACRERGLDPLTKLKVSSTARGKGTGDTCGMAIQDQFGGSAGSPIWKLSDDEKRHTQEEWRKRVEYGRRWLVEIVLSAFKRMFGEHLYSLKWESIVQDVRIKVATYNRLIDMGVLS